MTSAIVAINTDIGTETSVMERLCGIDAVESCYVVYGVYDIIAKIKADTIEDLEQTVSANIRKIPEVRTTLTLIVCKEYKK